MQVHAHLFTIGSHLQLNGVQPRETIPVKWCSQEIDLRFDGCTSRKQVNDVYILYCIP